MKVYVVLRGEEYEGSEIQGIFFTREKAEKCVQSTIEKITSFAPSHYQNWEHDQNEWWLGCYYVNIEEHEVQ